MRRLWLNGGQIEYVWHGPRAGTAPTLVFLHEGLGTAAMWRDLPPDLAQATGCSALAYSRFGYGGSDPCELPRPLTYHGDEASQVLPDLLDRLGVRRYVLIGHSDGATIALLHAAGAPSGLLAVIAEAPHVFVEDMTLAGIAATQKRYENGLRDSLRRHHGANVDVAFRGWAETWLNPAFRSWNVEAEMRHIKAPMLLIQGRQDEYASLEQIHHIAARVRGPADCLVVEDCGHTPHREQAEPVTAAMVRFIEHVLRKGRSNERYPGPSGGRGTQPGPA